MDTPWRKRERTNGRQRWLPAALGALFGTALMLTLAVGAGALAAGPHPAASGSGGDPPAVVSGPPAPLQLSDNITQGLTGYSVAIQPPTVVVGIPAASFGDEFQEGAAMVVNTTTGASTMLQNPDPIEDGDFGFSVAISGNLLVVSNPGASAVTVYNANTLAPITTLTDPAQVFGFFGYSVAVSGSTVVVGAPINTASGYSGAGQVFVYTSPTWEHYVLSSPSPQDEGLFGLSVGVSGPTIVVGAGGQDVGDDTSAGLAYEFSAGTGYLLRTFSSPWPVSGADTLLGPATFGSSVSVSGSVVAIGAPNSEGPDYSELPLSGAVFTYNLVTGAQNVLTGPDPQASAWFGTSVSLGAGGTWLAVGAPNESAPLTPNSGAAYLFSTTLGGALSATFTSPNANASGQFGASVSVDQGQLVVGAPVENNRTGFAYLYRSPALAFTGASVLQSGSQLGRTVATNGPLVVVGAPGWDGSNGTVYVLNTTTHTELTLAPPYPEPGIDFGFSVAISDGLIAVGAPLFSTSSVTALGAVWIYNAATGAFVQNITVPLADQTDGTAFGFSVALSGTNLVVGAPIYQDLNGTAFVCNVTSGLCPTVVGPLASSPGALLGYSVAVYGSTALIGVPLGNVTDLAENETGEVLVLSLGASVTTTVLVSPDPQWDGIFGGAVALDANQIVVGSFGQNLTTVDNAGVVFVFNAATLAPVGQLVSPNPSVDGDFGASVAISGSTIVVGAPGENSSSPQEGTLEYAGNAYLYNAQNDQVYLAFPAAYATPYGELGYAVAISGSTVVIGAPEESVGPVFESGVTYIL